MKILSSLLIIMAIISISIIPAYAQTEPSEETGTGQELTDQEIRDGLARIQELETTINLFKEIFAIDGEIKELSNQLYQETIALDLEIDVIEQAWLTDIQNVDSSITTAETERDDNDTAYFAKKDLYALCTIESECTLLLNEITQLDVEYVVIIDNIDTLNLEKTRISSFEHETSLKQTVFDKYDAVYLKYNEAETLLVSQYNEKVATLNNN